MTKKRSEDRAILRGLQVSLDAGVRMTPEFSKEAAQALGRYLKDDYGSCGKSTAHSDREIALEFRVRILRGEKGAAIAAEMSQLFSKTGRKMTPAAIQRKARNLKNEVENDAQTLKNYAGYTNGSAYIAVMDEMDGKQKQKRKRRIRQPIRR